ncbi:MAG: LysM peptidoglycan-binding domain-containing M23 family metallopeptidase [Pseudorhodoplanes sp.]|nr:hypothetical protein [Pseudorhodoplanes sp.]MBW7948757.1 LysM peptidoglycan-binding domain-containing M23 family metallopeptidase [Pseudorhodoplanes sp.]MCL4712759.1 LysM peptidoglycan-binding domain-containing M23 family metallopeptidase [Pseudorhodoplanes sp.]GIK82425.1 MAG: lipoprotein [Alphaproteobacteria bacterium]
MRPPVGPVRSSSWPCLAIAVAAPILLAGCSSESGRFNEGAFSNPFRSSGAPTSGDVTGSVPQRSAQVETRPLPSHQGGYQQPYPQRSAPPATRPAQTSGIAGGGPGLASYQPSAAQPAPPPAPHYEVTGSVRAPAAPPPAAARPSSNGPWQWEGGSAITVGDGETLDTVSNRFGVPASAIAQANGLPPNAYLYPGQRLVIPRYNYSTPPQASAPAPAPMRATVNTTSHRTTPVPATSGQVHVVAPGESLMGIARRYGKSVTELAAANNIQPHHKVLIGDRLVIPGARPATNASRVPPPAPAPQRYASAPAPMPTARVATPVAEAVKDEPPTSADAHAGAAGFRWPARGRIIAGFGPKPTGQQNDGVNIALPEGTPVKAADDGVVAYAGSELKGYGNLVLVRHSNGYVTAYAHASELLVKRGDTIKRGQVIAKSGQTGNVTSPQLHFEIRKGATPVDPMQHLPAAG